MSENKRPRIDPSPLEALQSMLNTSIQDPNDASPPTTGMSSSSMILKEIILIGGGHAHVHVIKMIGMKPIPGVRVTVISRDVLTPYSGMLPGYIAGYYSSEQLHIDIMKLTSFAHMRLIHCEAMGLDKIQKLVHLKDGRPSIRYDILSIDIGSCPRPLPSSFTHSNTTPITAVKPIDSFSNRWQMSLQNILQSPPIVPLNVVIVGGGAGGVELTFAIHFRLKQEFKQRQWDFSMITVTLVTRGKHVLTSHNQQVSDAITRIMNQKGIKMINNTEVVDASSKSSSQTSQSVLVSSDGKQIPYDHCFWCIQASAQGWLRDAGLAIDADGFVSVDATLQSINTPDVFAAGDVCHLVSSPRPKAGVFAVRAGPPLLDNIRRRLFGEPLLPWEPQTEFLGIIGTYGDGLSENSEYAVASKGPLALEGAYLWELKDRIDRNWMLGYQQLPSMSAMANANKESAGITNVLAAPVLQLDDVLRRTLEKASMRCGGCGSKVGSQVLTRALRRITSSIKVANKDGNGQQITSELGDDDAAICVPPPFPLLSVHTIDFFKTCYPDPYLFGQIAANHALSDIYAMNGEPTSALAMCTVPYGPESQVEDTLVHILAGGLKVLAEAGCSLVGGHTTEGTELSFGLSVNGQVHPDCMLRKGPLQPRCVLILTKALGTGTILAAHMRGSAKAEWVVSALESMTQSNSTAAKILHRAGAVACTDVTGFGFLGHLLEMQRFGQASSQTSDGSCALVVNDLNSINELEEKILLNMSLLPMLPGAVECVAQGVLSSLQSQNIRSAQAIGNVDIQNLHPAFHMLFDPQTSGGLLACVPIETATDAVEELRAAGYVHSAVVGETYDTKSFDEVCQYTSFNRRFSVWLKTD